MPAQITVTVKGTAATVIANGKVSVPSNGDIWDLPASVTIPSGGTVDVTATADAVNPDAVFPGLALSLNIETPVSGWTAAHTALAITPVVFRTNFPEFANTTNFPSAQVQYWLNWAALLLNARRFGVNYSQAQQLFAAHNLAEERRAFLEAAQGAPPGMAIGPASSKSVDKVAVSYDIAAVSEKDAGDWNQTIYGRRLWQMIQMFGMGPIQVGVGCTPPWVFANGMAWPGPPAWPGSPGWSC